MLINAITDGLAAIGSSTPTTYGVDFSGLPPLLQTGVLIGFAVAGMVMAWLSHKKAGQSPPEQQVIRDQRSKMEMYFDNPVTVQEIRECRVEVRHNHEEIRDCRNEVRALREAVSMQMVTIAGGVRDSVNEEIRRMGQAVEHESSKNRELMRRQDELKQNTLRMMEQNLQASIRGHLKEISDKVEEWMMTRPRGQR